MTTLPEPDPELQRLAAKMASTDQRAAELVAADAELRRLVNLDALARRRAQQAAEQLAALARRRWIAWLWPFGNRAHRGAAALATIERARQDIAELEPAIVSARGRRDALRRAEADTTSERAEFAAALAARAAVVRASGGDAARRLLASDAKLAEIDTELQQVDGWLEQARACQHELDLARSELQRAHGLSVVDLVGGGAITSVLKHDRFDQARLLLTRAQRQLQQLGTTRRQQSINDLSPGLRIADIAFDCVFTDLASHRAVEDLIALAGNWRSELLAAIGTGLARARELRTARGEAEALRTRWLLGVPTADAGG
ncbi:MAG: hypothetical protein MUC36_09100 [Planctomycetes bacterium]|nr:hypothetical protein [Planctomycetota bacterium]